ncbi:proline-rich protein 29 [Melozone crissalis]|uniref:proline-rich protein 29 n=1 Tax=Melozone crissalis TaxID=40204 RepID=UPI0023D9ECD8|nr:proline-rich protein 29 [Melozone crissalis]
MERGEARDPRGLWGHPRAGTPVLGVSPERSCLGIDGIGPRAPGSQPGAFPEHSRCPVLILQPLPGPGAAPAGPPPARPGLMELMMIQGSQMHQLLMHGLAMAALMPLGAGTAPAQALAGPWQDEDEEEEEAVVFHHHYLPWTPPRPPPVLFLPPPGTPSMVTELSLLLSGRAVPPPPPPSATGTVGPGVPPAEEFYTMEQQRGL